MSKSNWIAIINMTAGGGKTKRDWPSIAQILQREGIRYEPYFTDRRLHASIIARNKIKEGYTEEDPYHRGDAGNDLCGYRERLGQDF